MEVESFNFSYINKPTYDRSNLTYLDLFRVETKKGFINTPNETTPWVKGSYLENMFNYTLKISEGEFVNVLNTPYFHKQLFADFMDTDVNGPNGRYTASAYLFLNSLPFVDLDDNVNYDGMIIMVSSLFREISTSQYVPYFLMLKWGSIYHRYKKYILEGVDIISGITTPINTKSFFDNNTNN